MAPCLRMYVQFIAEQSGTGEEGFRGELSVAVGAEEWTGWAGADNPPKTPGWGSADARRLLFVRVSQVAGWLAGLVCEGESGNYGLPRPRRTVRARWGMEIVPNAGRGNSG